MPQINLIIIATQSWSNSGVEPDNNYTSEIEDVVSEQRQLIAEEMLDYPYPAGRYNISARLVPLGLVLYRNWLNYGGASITITSDIIKLI
jgi:hypothetical protein